MVQSLETINLVYPDNLCSHTNRSIVLCLRGEVQLSYVTLFSETAEGELDLHNVPM